MCKMGRVILIYGTSLSRAWFLRAYFADRSGQSKTVALQYYNSIVDVLEWGATTWHDVPTSDRGVIFLKTFVRAIRRIRLEAYLSVRFAIADVLIPMTDLTMMDLPGIEGV